MDSQFQTQQNFEVSILSISITVFLTLRSWLRWERWWECKEWLLREWTSSRRRKFERRICSSSDRSEQQQKAEKKLLKMIHGKSNQNKFEVRIRWSLMYIWSEEPFWPKTVANSINFGLYIKDNLIKSNFDSLLDQVIFDTTLVPNVINFIRKRHIIKNI